MNTLNCPKQVWVIIVTYNGIQWIQSCLLSIKRSTYPVKIVVVDNASTDDTTGILQRDFPEVELLGQDQNLGFGQANNFGICFAMKHGADFVFLLNQDTEIEAECVERLVCASENHKYSLLSPLHFDGSRKTLDRGFKRYALERITQEDLDQWQRNGDDSIFESGFINAAAWFVPVATLEKVGGFAPLFFHYGEDRDFVNRMYYFSLRIGVVPLAKIYHFREQRGSIAHWDANKKLRYYHVGVITRAANINVPLVKGVWHGLLWSVKEAVYMFFFKSDWIALSRFVKVMRNLVDMLPVITKHRRDVKEASRFKFLPCISE